MPHRPKTPCAEPGCSVLVTSGRCDAHKRPVHTRALDRKRSSTRSGYGYKWQKASASYLRAHPLCQCDECKEGVLRVRASKVTDHIIPHRGDMKLFWDPDNWQAMAKECHDKKTAREDGGFGNPVARGGSKA